MVWWINEDVLEQTEKEFCRADIEEIVSRGLDHEEFDDPFEEGIFEFYLANCEAIAQEQEDELDQRLAEAGL